jgi:hypothetical protein
MRRQNFKKKIQLKLKGEIKMKTNQKGNLIQCAIRRSIMIFIMLLLSFNTYAGYTSSYNRWGGSNRYKVFVEIWYYYSDGTRSHLCYGSDHGWTWAGWSCNYSPNACVSVRIGSGCYTIDYTNNWHYSTGTAFIPPLPITGDTLGIARNNITEEENISSIGNSTTIVLQNFIGSLCAAINTHFGSSYRIIIWRKDDSNDVTITPSKVLWEAGIRVENGQAIALGGFDLSDFVVANASDSSGYPVIKVTPISGLMKTINVNFPGSDSLVAVTTAGDVGFGAYDPSAIFQPSTNNIPTLSQWGIIIFTFLLIVAGVVYIRRRQILRHS